MKVCKACKQEKSKFDFYPKQGDCKACRCAAVREYRLHNLEKCRAYDRLRSQRPFRKAKLIASLLEWKAKHWFEHQQRHRAKYPEKYKARTAVGNAIRDGRLARGVCKVCSSLDVHAHHDDYSKPLEVTWLCNKHHNTHHRPWIGEYQQVAAS